MATHPFAIFVNGVLNYTATNAARTTTTATVTIGTHSLIQGSTVEVALATGPTGYTALNGVYTLTGVTATTITYTTTTSGTVTSGAATGTVIGSLLDDYSTANPELPCATPDSVSLTADGAGQGAAIAFDVMQVKTPAAGPWWQAYNTSSGVGVEDNARVRFMTSGTAEFLGTIVDIQAQPLDNGLGTMATLTAANASAFLEKVPFYQGLTTTSYNPATSRTGAQYVDNWNYTGTDFEIIDHILKFVDKRLESASSAEQTATRAIVDTSIVTGTQRFTRRGAASASLTVQIIPTTLRGALDAVCEAASSDDGKVRRYNVGPDGRLRYGTVSAAVPTYATAPFQITDTPSAETAGSTLAISKLVPRDLRVSLDHDSVAKRLRFVLKSSSSDFDTNTTDPQLRTYDLASPQGAARTARKGPLAGALVQAATSITANRGRGPKIDKLAVAFFGTDALPYRMAPLRSIQFTVRGAGAGSNAYGWAYGYAEAAATPYSLVSGWNCDQYVKITNTAMGLAGDLYKIESISMTFERGSLIRKFDITCERARRTGLAKLIRQDIG